jgi:hypothetical protein
MPEDRSTALAALSAAVRRETGTLHLCFPHRFGDGEHAVITCPSAATAAGAAPVYRGDEASIDVLLDLRGLGWLAEDGYDPGEYPDEMWDGIFTPVALPDDVAARVWACFDEGAVGLAWQHDGGRRYLVLLPDEFDTDLPGWATISDVAGVSDDWPAFLFTGLFAPVAIPRSDEDDLDDEEREETSDDWRAMRTPAQNAASLHHASRLLEAWTVRAADSAAGPVTTPGPITLDEAYTLLGWTGAGHPGAPADVVVERYGAQAGRMVFEWTSRGYTETDRAHYTGLLGDVDHELLLWNTDDGARFETLMGWLDGNEPLLHGVDAAVVVEAVRVSCEAEQAWTAEQVRHLWDRGLRDPAWWHVLAHGFKREHSLFERDPVIVAALRVKDKPTPWNYTLITYAHDWAAAMPLDVAVWYIAHRVPRTLAVTAYADGGFNPDAFRTLWALAPTGSGENERLVTLDRHVVARWPHEPSRTDFIPLPKA